MRAALSRYYAGWTHADTGKLSRRTARGYYNRIPTTETMFAGNEAPDDDEGFDIDSILEEAEAYGMKPPKK